MLCKDWAYELVGFMDLLDLLFLLVISLDLPFSSSLIILLISSTLQSYRKILLGFKVKYVIIFGRRYRFVHIWCK